ncbi:hypothetical protein Emed_000775 [Eimeria media]
MFAASRLLLAVAAAAIVAEAGGGARRQLANSFLSRKADFLAMRALESYTASPRIENDSFAFSSTLPPAPSSRKGGGAVTVGFMAVVTIALLVSYILMHCCSAFPRGQDAAAADASTRPESLKVTGGEGDDESSHGSQETLSEQTETINEDAS